MPESREQFQFDLVGAITLASRDRWVATHNGEVTGVTLSVGTAPTGAALICDLHKNGVSMFTTTANRPTIAAAGTKTPTRSAAPDVARFVTGDEIMLVPTQVGSTVAGSDLNVSVEYVTN